MPVRRRIPVLYGGYSALICLWLACFASGAVAQSVEDCLTCHEDQTLEGERDGHPFSAYVDPAIYSRSSHRDLECINCHAYLDGVEDFPHDEIKPEPVDCSPCHDNIAELYAQSLHGQAAAAGEALAPKCWDCHGTHDIAPPVSEDSRVAKFNIPVMCGRCHKEGSPVDRTYDIPQDSILAHYSFSMHGEGLYKRGLIVTAVCTDCHTAHFVLPHTDPRSSIFRDNVASTCQKCHGRIEAVHQKVIRGELWEKEPDQVPVCVDCHQPHEVRRVFYGEISNEECLACHAKPDLSMTRDGFPVSLYVDTVEFQNSIHRGQACAQCHTNANPRLKRPCTTVAAKVDCGICHPQVVETFATCTHGMLGERGDPDAPRCTDCHGTHGVRGRLDPKSPTFPTKVPGLCSRCHRSGGTAATRRLARGDDVDADNYPMSSHGKGLLESGLVVTAMCTDCHTAHHVLPKDNPESSISHQHVAQTCARCHSGIYEKFTASIHGDTLTTDGKKLPNCADCHQSHTIVRTDSEGFKQRILGQC